MVVLAIFFAAAVVIMFLLQAGMAYLVTWTGIRIPYHHVRFWREKPDRHKKTDILCLFGLKKWEFACENGKTVNSDSGFAVFFKDVDQK